MNLDDLREELASYGKRILGERLASGAGGNISARHADFMLISPSGLSLEEVEPPQFVQVDIRRGEVLNGGLMPSSEVLMHLSCYRRRPDLRAVVHVHPQFVIALTSSGHDLKPMFADAIIYLGRRIPHIDYITVTTPQLAQAVEIAVVAANCIVLRNHGVVAVGESLKEAFWRCCTAEEAARIQLLATLVGKPRFLDEEEADRLESLASEQYRRKLLAEMKMA